MEEHIHNGINQNVDTFRHIASMFFSQGSAAAFLVGRAVQLFAAFRGNRPVGGARWVDVTSPL